MATRPERRRENQEYYVQLGRRIEKARLRRGWTAARLAKECEIRPSVLCRYESGERHVSTQMLLAIAKALGVEFMYFIHGDERVLPNRQFILQAD